MRQQPAARFTTVPRKSEESAAVQMSRELHPTTHAGHGQATKSQDVRLHAERDVAFAGVVWQAAAAAVHVAPVESV